MKRRTMTDEEESIVENAECDVENAAEEHTNMQRYKFVVVEFGKRKGHQGTFEILSSRWVCGGHTYWPPYRNSLQFVKMLQRHLEPVREVWPTFPIKRIVGETEDFQTAEKLLEDSDADKETVVRSSRGKVPCRYLNSPEVKNVTGKKRAQKRNVSSTLRNSLATGNEDSSDDVNGSSSEIEEQDCVPEPKIIDISDLASKLATHIETEATETQQNAGGSQADAEQTQTSPEIGKTKPSVTIPPSDDDDDLVEGSIFEYNCLDNEDLSLDEAQQTKTLEVSAKSDESSKDLKDYIDKKFETLSKMIAERFDELSFILTSKSAASNPTLTNVDKVYQSLPCKSYEEFKTFEDALNSPDVVSSLIKRLRLFHGPNLTAFVNICLRKVMSNEMAEKFTWHGVSNQGKIIKLEFRSTKTAAMLQRAVVDELPKLKTTPPANLQNFTHGVQSWLKDAKKRSSKSRSRAGSEQRTEMDAQERRVSSDRVSSLNVTEDSPRTHSGLDGNDKTPTRRRSQSDWTNRSPNRYGGGGRNYSSPYRFSPYGSGYNGGNRQFYAPRRLYDDQQRYSPRGSNNRPSTSRQVNYQN
ncbi:Hypothetical predicted protein [Cloeon dipterum]|uniref:DUF4806 domain-containing protein n=1 Tax=Cloeon dipterum TaxID=197152 RepID=A0A8S1E7M1_9INSE|nr:Hypothetical predicted protein [Cloeon dipterum]